MKKVFALWLLSLWFVAVAYSDEVGSNAESEGSGIKEIVCRNGFDWVKDILEGKTSWVADFSLQCFRKNGKTQCYSEIQETHSYIDDDGFRKKEAMRKAFDKTFLENWIRNEKRENFYPNWFDKELDKLYNENCKEVEF